MGTLVEIHENVMGISWDLKVGFAGISSACFLFTEIYGLVMGDICFSSNYMYMYLFIYSIYIYIYI